MASMLVVREHVIAGVKAMLRPIVRHRFLLERMRFGGEEILGPQEGNDLLSKMVHQRGAAGKIGATEMKLCRVYLRRKDKAGYCASFGHYARKIYVSSGVYPNDAATLSRFCPEWLSYLKDLDLLVVWFNFGEAKTRRRYAPQAKLADVTVLEPYYHQRPWSAQLAGKRVIVVTPFAKGVAAQYQRRKQVWAAKPEVMPDFDLRTLRCPQIAGLVDQPENPDWFAGLDALRQQMTAMMPFDVAIIGAGAWSVPLAVHARSLGAFGIHIGGATQILFGIMGRRWHANVQIQAFVNDAWTRPSDEERPKKYILQEDGSYW